MSVAFPPSRSLFLVIIGTSTILLSACGGGGGGSSSPVSQNQLIPPTPQTSGQAAVTALSNSTVIFSDVPIQEPIFGSVMISAGIGFAQTRSISTHLDSDNLNIGLNVTRTDGSNLFLNSDPDLVRHKDLDPFWTNYKYFQEDLLEITTLSSGSQISGARINVHHHDGNANNDYTAFGYWADIKIDNSPSITAMEVGAFADGPEFDNSADLPITGTANYSGDVIAGFAYKDSRYAETGDYEGSLDLTVDFASNTISGCVGCGDKGTIKGLSYDSNTKTITPFDMSSDIILRLGNTSFDSNGQWTGSDLRLERTDVSVTSTTGKWAGKFSEVNNDNQEPTAAIGTAVGTWRESGGGEGAFFGSFMAVVDE